MKEIFEKENIELEQEIKNLKEKRKQNIKNLKLDIKKKYKEFDRELDEVKNKILTNKKYLEIINKKLTRQNNDKEKTTFQTGKVQDNTKKQKAH